MLESNGKLPALRPLDVVPSGSGEEELQFVLVDRLRIADVSIAVPAIGCFVLSHLNGQHTADDVQRLLLDRLHVRVPTESIVELVGVLDEALLLQNDRFELAYAERLAAYQAVRLRDNRERYPDAVALREQLAAIVRSGTAAEGPVTGLIAPHLDYERGGPAYADAYATLAAAEPADRYVILGTNHFGRARGVVATVSTFITPLGSVENDAGFVEQLEGDLGGGLRDFELDHQWEHSVELQVQMLQVVADGRPFRIVPILCHSPCDPSDDAASQRPDLAAVADALARLIRDDSARTVLIAGADLSHVGTNFGDTSPVTADRLGEVAQSDQALLTKVQRGDLDAFLAQIRESENPTRVCSVGCIYALRRALADRPCEILRYHQAVDFPTDTHVTCAAAVVR